MLTRHIVIMSALNGLQIDDIEPAASSDAHCKGCRPLFPLSCSGVLRLTAQTYALVEHGEDVIIAGSVSDEEQRRLPGRLEGSEALHPHRSSSAYRVTERHPISDLG